MHNIFIVIANRNLGGAGRAMCINICDMEKKEQNWMLETCSLVCSHIMVWHTIGGSRATKMNRMLLNIR